MRSEDSSIATAVHFEVFYQARYSDFALWLLRLESQTFIYGMIRTKVECMSFCNTEAFHAVSSNAVPFLLIDTVSI